MPLRRHLHLALLCLLVSSPRPVFAGDAQIEPPDVFQRVAQLRLEIEAIRLEMGRPKIKSREIEVHDALPREVYSQAQAVYEKADRLTFELTRSSLPPPVLPVVEAGSGDVYEAVEATRARIAAIRSSLGVTRDTPLPKRNASHDPTDVFRSMVQASRQLNAMLAVRIQPRDVFGQVSLAIAYAERLASVMGHQLGAEEPSFQSGKLPADVYGQLDDCLGILGNVATALGGGNLSLVHHDHGVGDVTTGDVFDLAILVVAELRHLNRIHGESDVLRSHHYPARIFPAHVFQRVGFMRETLQDLRREIESKASLVSVVPRE